MFCTSIEKNCTLQCAFLHFALCFVLQCPSQCTSLVEIPVGDSEFFYCVDLWRHVEYPPAGTSIDVQNK